MSADTETYESDDGWKFRIEWRGAATEDSMVHVETTGPLEYDVARDFAEVLSQKLEGR